jgi:hypothetical protein
MPSCWIPGLVTSQARGSISELRELLTRFNVPFHVHAAGSEEGRRLLKDRGLSATCSW